jgi:hypothetical protein
VIGVPSTLPSRAPRVTVASLEPPLRSGAFRALAPSLPLAAALLVTVPVFVQAPWVRMAPMAATLFTVPLVALGVVLEERARGPWRSFGALLVGFAGSWLGGSLFWGWARLHPVWHLPIEAFALPLALAGLRSRWRMAAGFYLASLLGTAATDAVMAAGGLMPFWPQVLAAGPDQAPALLQQAAVAALHPLPLTLTLLAGFVLVWLCVSLWRRGDRESLVAAATLATTLAVDGLFLLAAALAPRLSGLI